MEQVRALMFISLVFGTPALIYAVRDRKRLWTLRPSIWLLASSVADILIASTLAVFGFAMAPLTPLVVGGTLVAAIVLALLLGLVKLPLFARLGIT